MQERVMSLPTLQAEAKPPTLKMGGPTIGVRRARPGGIIMTRTDWESDSLSGDS
jgi:hypothetical protein